MKTLACALLLLSTISLPIFATDAEDSVKDRLTHRTGSASYDGRQKTLLGCPGDTFRADITINSVDVTISGKNADIYANYSGKYTRQGWGTPCAQGGHEDRDVRGRAHWTVRQRDVGDAEKKFVGISDLGEVNDIGHDSNKYASQAVQNAFNSAMASP